MHCVLELQFTRPSITASKVWSKGSPSASVHVCNCKGGICNEHKIDEHRGHDNGWPRQCFDLGFQFKSRESTCTLRLVGEDFHDLGVSLVEDLNCTAIRAAHVSSGLAGVILYSLKESATHRQNLKKINRKYFADLSFCINFVNYRIVLECRSR